MTSEIISYIEDFVKILLEKTNNKKAYIISHFDTDRITSAAILSKAFERQDMQFSIKIVKQLDNEEINQFPKEKIIILLDLGSSSFKKLSESENEILIIDHHEITDWQVPKNITILNPHLIEDYEELCASELTYLVSKKISEENKELAKLAVLGMVGDTMEKDISRIRNQIISDAEVKIKRGLLIYPSTRPIDKALEYSSRPFIPGVTGDSQGTFEILQEAGIEKIGNCYKSLLDLDETEMKNLVTAIMLRLNSEEKTSEYIGNL